MEDLFSRRNSYDRNNRHTLYKKNPSRHISVLWHFKEFIADCL